MQARKTRFEKISLQENWLQGWFFTEQHLTLLFSSSHSFPIVTSKQKFKFTCTFDHRKYLLNTYYTPRGIWGIMGWGAKNQTDVSWNSHSAWRGRGSDFYRYHSCKYCFWLYCQNVSNDPFVKPQWHILMNFTDCHTQSRALHVQSEHIQEEWKPNTYFFFFLTKDTNNQRRRNN